MQFGDIFIPPKCYLLAESSDLTGCPVFYQATLLLFLLRYQVKWRTGKRGQCLGGEDHLNSSDLTSHVCLKRERLCWTWFVTISVEFPILGRVSHQASPTTN